MKYLLLFLTIFISSSVIAQTLKITSVETSRPSDYQDMASAHLGKTVSLKFFDNAVSMLEQGSKTPEYFKKTGEDQYGNTSTEGNTTYTVFLEIHETVGIITSLTIESTVKYGSQEPRTVTLIAKRF